MNSTYAAATSHVQTLLSPDAPAVAVGGVDLCQSPRPCDIIASQEPPLRILLVRQQLDFVDPVSGDVCRIPTGLYGFAYGNATFTGNYRYVCDCIERCLSTRQLYTSDRLAPAVVRRTDRFLKHSRTRQ